MLFIESRLWAGPAEELFEKANVAYQSNDFDLAIKNYLLIEESGFQSADLSYNLGNAYFRLGRIGTAILHYERAKLMAPGNEDIIHNLQVAQQKVEQRDALPDFFLTKIWRNLRSIFSSGMWGILALLLWWLGIAGLSFWLIGKTRNYRKKGFLIGMTSLVISILPFSLAYSSMSFGESSQLAIILHKEVVLKSAPDAAGSDILPLYEGEKVELLDNLSEFWQVRLLNGEKGWVSEKDLEQI